MVFLRFFKINCRIHAAALQMQATEKSGNISLQKLAAKISSFLR